jgi:ATP-binding cassette subfamily F protein uup
MTPYLDVQNLTKSFGAQTLFRNISFSVGEGQKVGLIAKNGTGKSTLLEILAGKEGYDDGQIIYRNDIRVGYLEQTPKFDPDESVLDACFNHEGNPDKVLRAKQILTQLHITDLDQPMRQLSGGQQKRVALANALLNEPDFLILDEPTNHLDLEMIVWLEGYLSRSTLTLLMVTHDRYFLDRVCKVILELDNQTIYSYKGNYSFYLEKRQERIENQTAEIARAKNLYRTELEWMRRMPQARGHKARYREEAFYDLQAKAHQRIEERQMRLKASNVYIGSKIFECQYVSKKFTDSQGNDKIILDNFYYNFARFEKMGIVGNNGTGKSTFIKMLLGIVPPDSGKFDIGETVRFGYFSQEGMKFNNEEKVIDVITDIADYIDLGGGRHMTASQFLNFFMFTPEQQHNYVYKLSGGERRKLYLCTVLMRNPNFLVLDEPTNDLDIQTLQVLEQYLEDFPGCVIVVSHDRYFMDKVVDHLLIFKGNGVIKDFPGNYTQYREWNSLQSKDEAEKDKTEKPTTKKDYHHDTRRRMSYKEKREFEQLTADIEKLEKEQKQLEGALCSGTLSVEELTEKSKRLPKLKEELDDKSMRWLELSELDN